MRVANISHAQEQIDGAKYYAGQHAILRRKRTVIGENGDLVEVHNLPNNRIVDNQYAKAVDQKNSYLLGKPFTVSCQNTAYAELLQETLGKQFRRTLFDTGKNALNGAIGWIYPYYDSEGELCFKDFPAYEILPFWEDEKHTELACAARIYEQEVWEGKHKKIIRRVELYKQDGIYRYVMEGERLVPDVFLGEHTNYITIEDAAGKAMGYNWTKIPLVPFKCNSDEIPLIRRTKGIQDEINLFLSDFANNMQEDSRNTILVLTNYDGQDLGEFRRNLATYGAVKVQDDGGVSTLTVEVKAENYKAILDLLEKKMLQNARGYDARDERMSGNPNQMNIQSMYADIDIDANAMETQFQAGLEQLLWFINQHYINTGKGDYTREEADIVFNRDVLVNEAESIDECKASVGILSAETIVEQHPWTKDARKEMERLKKEKQEDMEQYEETFQGAQETRAAQEE